MLYILKISQFEKLVFFKYCKFKICDRIGETLVLMGFGEGRVVSDLQRLV